MRDIYLPEVRCRKEVNEREEIVKVRGSFEKGFNGCGSHTHQMI